MADCKPRQTKLLSFQSAAPTFAGFPRNRFLIDSSVRVEIANRLAKSEERKANGDLCPVL